MQQTYLLWQSGDWSLEFRRRDVHVMECRGRGVAKKGGARTRIATAGTGSAARGGFWSREVRE